MKQFNTYQHNSIALSANVAIWKQNILIRLILLVLLGFMMIKVAKAQPVISSFSPASGAVGASVVIAGSNFDATPANNVVYFGATQAIVTAATVSSLTVTVPSGGTYQPITVVNITTGLIGYSANNFNITYNSGIGQSITAASFKARVNFTTGLSPSAIVAVADLDGDGKPDLITVDRMTNTFSVLRNTSTSGTITTSSFAAKVDFSTDSTPGFVVVGDLDGDGKPEIVVANQFKNTITVYKNKANSGSITTSSFATPVKLLTDTLSLPTSVAIADMDGDGKAELIIVNSYRDKVSVLKNIGAKGVVSSATFAAAINYTTGTGPTTVVVADIDGDGKPDMAISNFSAKSVSVLRNTTKNNTIDSTSFAAKVDFTVGTGPNSVIASDLNGDGKPELISVNQGSNTISVLTNKATSGTITATSFSTKFDLPSNGESPYYVAATNLDGDNIPDLVVANLLSNRLTVIKNNYATGTLAASSFSAPVSFTTGNYPYAVSVADFDGDGKPDLAVPNFGDNTISIFQNALQNITNIPGDTIKGNIVSPSGAAVSNVNINYTGTMNGSVTDTTSAYTLNLTGSGNYIVSPYKNNDIYKVNGVSTIDAVLIQSHILGKNILNSPYKLIAADVNGDGKVTAIDIVYIKRLILGIDTTFTNSATSQNRLWAFVDSNYKFADTTNPFPFKDSITYNGLNANQTNQTFIGIKLGDVNWDWNPAIAKMPNPVFIKPKKITEGEIVQ